MSATSQPPPPAAAPSSRHYGWTILALIVLTVFVALGLARHGYASILPSMQDALKLSNAQTGELQSWNLVGYLLTVVFAGLLSARYGPRRVIGLGLGITVLALLVTGLFPTFGAARLGRFLAGVGGAASNVPAMALISAWFGVQRRGVASGIGVAGSSLGLMVTGPLVPAILSQSGSNGWQVCWWVLGGLACLASLPIWLLLRNRPEEMGLAPVGETPAEAQARQEAHGASSLDWGLVYRSRVLWHLAAVYFAFGFSYIIYSTFFVRCLVKEAGYTQPAAGLLWLKVGMVSALSGFLWGSLSDRWGRRLVLVSVFVLQGGSFLLLGWSLQPGAIYLSAGLFALTAWSIPALMAALSGDLFGGRLAPAALGLMTIVFGLGQALGPWLAGRMADGFQSFGPALMTAGGVALLGAAGSWLLAKAPNRTSKG